MVAFIPGKDYDVSKELNEMKYKYQEKYEKQGDRSFLQCMGDLFSIKFLKPFSCAGVLNILNTMHGFSCLLVYLNIYLKSTNAALNLQITSGIIAIVRIIIALIVPFIISRFSPKFLFVSSYVFSVFPITIIGILAYLQTNNIGTE